MLITAIAALDENRLLAGKDGIPWKLPRDSRHFRETTNGHRLLLGRTTYEQMIGWFDRHVPIVLTSDPEYQLQSAGQVVQSVDQAVLEAEEAGEEELFIGGGGQVYRAAMPDMNRLLLTRVEHAFPEPPGAVYFPLFLLDDWELTEVRRFPADADNPLAIRIEDWRQRP